MLPDDALITRADHHPWCDLGTEVVVLRTRDRSYYRLEHTGRDVWLLLEHPRPLRDLVAALQERHEGDPDVMAADTRSFLDECAEIGLIAVDPTRG